MHVLQSPNKGEDAMSIVGSNFTPEIPFTIPEISWLIGGALIVVGAVIMVKGLMERRRRTKN